jgi:hypothetical protein
VSLCRPLPNGNIEVGVHIADVTHFLLPGTAMDLEAASRATTTYLVQRRIDMLPKPLTEDICSLRCEAVWHDCTQKPEAWPLFCCNFMRLQLGACECLLELQLCKIAVVCAYLAGWRRGGVEQFAFSSLLP